MRCFYGGLGGIWCILSGSGRGVEWVRGQCECQLYLSRKPPPTCLPED
jgi:hypothetical protein